MKHTRRDFLERMPAAQDMTLMFMFIQAQEPTFVEKKQD